MKTVSLSLSLLPFLFYFLINHILKKTFTSALRQNLAHFTVVFLPHTRPLFPSSNNEALDQLEILAYIHTEPCK